MSSESSSLNKLPKLTKSSEYLKWKRKAIAFIRREEPSLSLISTKNTIEGSLKAWEEKRAKAKSAIILCLGDAVLTKTTEVVDEDTTSAKKPWDELTRISATYSQQSITKPQNPAKHPFFR